MIAHSEKKTPAWLMALGREGLPDEIALTAGTYRLERVFKHDFFAATGKYVDPSGDAVVLKVSRRERLLFLPMGWLGRIICGHESRSLAALDDLDVVPAYVERFGEQGLVHTYVDGDVLRPGQLVGEEFFERLQTGIDQIHDRRRAYVDLEKCDNVIVGTDGKPYLCDFQIAWHWPARLGGELWPMRVVRRWMQEGDHYHLRKLKRRVRPDLLSAEELALVKRKPTCVRWVNRLLRPFKMARRFVLARIDPVEDPIDESINGRRAERGERGRVEPAS